MIRFSIKHIEQRFTQTLFDFRIQFLDQQQRQHTHTHTALTNVHFILLLLLRALYISYMCSVSSNVQSHLYFIDPLIARDILAISLERCMKIVKMQASHQNTLPFAFAFETLKFANWSNYLTYERLNMNFFLVAQFLCEFCWCSSYLTRQYIFIYFFHNSWEFSFFLR